METITQTNPEIWNTLSAAAADLLGHHLALATDDRTVVGGQDSAWRTLMRDLVDAATEELDEDRVAALGALRQGLDEVVDEDNEAGLLEKAERLVGGSLIEVEIATASTSCQCGLALIAGRPDLIPAPWIGDLDGAWRRLDGRQRDIVRLYAPSAPDAAENAD